MDIQTPPPFCEYSNGPCDQSFDKIDRTQAFFFYGSKPSVIAGTIDEAIRKLRVQNGELRFGTWKEMPVVGQLIFCHICKAQRFTGVSIADVTTLNFNVLFEIGYSLGLGVPVIPIRDTTYSVDSAEFSDLGLLDTLGYLDFQNSDELAAKLPRAIGEAKMPLAATFKRNHDAPVYFVRSPITTDGQIKLFSAMKKSGMKFRTFDPKEASRLSLQDAYREVKSSLGFVAHLLADIRKGSLVHNARSALLAGMALASGEYVLMLQEGPASRPIDYRDIIQPYTDPSHVQALVTPFVKQLYDGLQSSNFVPITLPLKALESLDLGDIAAENEINALRHYFFPTAQYTEARRGHARLVVGRKGAGKTAIFYGIRNAYWTSQEKIVLDLKPEGHQFTKLRENVLQSLSKGMQEHVLTAFWIYLLQMEIANRIIQSDFKAAPKSPERFALYEKIRSLYSSDPTIEEGDFSERLLTLVDTISERAGELPTPSTSGDVTKLLYSQDLPELSDRLGEYLRFKDGVWLLIDNLDKGWPVAGAEPEDILILRSLLEATRKLQRSYGKRQIDFNLVVFLRNDIYDHLLRETSDKDKDTAVTVEWTDQEALQEVVRRRMVASTGADKSFEELWTTFFDSHVHGEFSFSYILRRTLMRPRDLLRLLRQCVNVAVNRNHDRVLERDIEQAERGYSEDMLKELSYELRDISPEYANVVYAFIGVGPHLSEEEVNRKLADEAMVNLSSIPFVLNLLLWFGFLGVLDRQGEEVYSYEFQYGVDRMLLEAAKPVRFVIHSAFRPALGQTA